MPLRSCENFKLVMSRHIKELRGAPKRGALGHGLFSLCVNPSLGKSSVVASWKSDFCLLLKLKIFSDLLSMGEVQACASTQ